MLKVLNKKKKNKVIDRSLSNNDKSIKYLLKKPIKGGRPAKENNIKVINVAPFICNLQKVIKSFIVIISPVALLKA
jgi:hypothetical protein